MKRFEKKVVIVTGAANGIGEACALRFADEGANVTCLDMAAEANEKVAAACRAKGVEALAMVCDVTDKASVEAAVQKTVDAWGKVDVLVASAGIYTGAVIEEVSLEEWKRTIDINLTGTFLCNQAVAPLMKQQKSGSIINISSMAGKTSFSASASYSSSKSGVIGLTRSLAVELAPYGATVNAVCPGNTLTAMVRGVAEKVGKLEGMTGAEWLQMRANDCPMQRLAEPWEMAGVVAFLASEDSRYLTGQSLSVDGGMVLY